jgi:hypothetical protein
MYNNVLTPENAQQVERIKNTVPSVKSKKSRNFYIMFENYVCRQEDNIRLEEIDGKPFLHPQGVKIPFLRNFFLFGYKKIGYQTRYTPIICWLAIKGMIEKGKSFDEIKKKFTEFDKLFHDAIYSLYDNEASSLWLQRDREQILERLKEIELVKNQILQ